MGFSGAPSFSHYHRFGFSLCVRHVSTFLPPFAPRPLRRFLATMKALTPGQVSLLDQVSLLHVSCRFNHSVTNHLESPRRRLSRCLSAQRASCSPQVWASPLVRGLAATPGRIVFVSYRLVDHLLLLSTAIAGPQLHSVTGWSVYLKRTFTSLTEHARKRTDRRAPARPNWVGGTTLPGKKISACFSFWRRWCESAAFLVLATLGRAGARRSQGVVPVAFLLLRLRFLGGPTQPPRLEAISRHNRQ